MCIDTLAAFLMKCSFLDELHPWSYCYYSELFIARMWSEINILWETCYCLCCHMHFCPGAQHDFNTVSISDAQKRLKLLHLWEWEFHMYTVEQQLTCFSILFIYFFVLAKIWSKNRAVKEADADPEDQVSTYWIGKKCETALWKTEGATMETWGMMLDAMKTISCTDSTDWKQSCLRAPLIHLLYS